MPAGLQVYSDSGLIQIDDRYSNLALRTKFTATTASGTGPNYSFWTYTTVVTATYPIVAMSGPRIALLGCVNIGGNQWQLQFVSPAQATFTAYIFDYPVSPGNNFGLQVFRDDGGLAFDSNIKYAKVAAIIQRPAGQPSGNGGGSGQNWDYLSLPAGNYAAIMPSRVGVFKIANTSKFMIADFLQTQTTGISVVLQMFIADTTDTSAGGGTWIDTSLSTTIAILDVTGL